MLQKNKWLFAVAGVILLTALVVFTVVACRKESIPPDTPEVTMDEEALWGTAPEETLGIAVDTAYATFYYPEQWRDMVKAELTEEENRSTTTFFTELSGKNAELFSVILSSHEEDGYLLGQLTKEQGEKINVYTRMKEFSADDWTEDELSQLSAMQERVNDIIVQFYENEDFSPNR